MAEVEPLIDAHKGNVAKIAQALGVSRGTIWNRLSESAVLRDKLTDARETLLDDLEQTLYDKALAGDIAALIFALKTQGKHRGFTERTELTGQNGGPLEVAVKGYRTVSPDEWPDDSKA